MERTVEESPLLGPTVGLAQVGTDCGHNVETRRFRTFLDLDDNRRRCANSRNWQLT